jgi:hypothetical protein
MGRFLSWIVALAAIALIGWWAWTTFGTSTRHYAPAGKGDAELDSQPVPEPLPAAPAAPAKAADTDGLPSAPIPYDQMKKGDPNAAPPKKDSDAKSVFY